jgi:hypothetical protein
VDAVAPQLAVAATVTVTTPLHPASTRMLQSPEYWMIVPFVTSQS